VLAESIGIPLPGSTALLTAGILAADGKLNITIVCVLGIVVTLAGASVPFAVGRRWGIRALEAPGPLRDHRKRALLAGMPIVARFGWLTAFGNRFVPGLKECGVLLVGAFGMRWREFVPWNFAGGVLWVLSHALLGYFLGRALGVAGSIKVLAAISAAFIVAAIAFRYLRKRMIAAAPPEQSRFDGR
jgi:membrane-associated protein